MSGAYNQSGCAPRRRLQESRNAPSAHLALAANVKIIAGRNGGAVIAIGTNSIRLLNVTPTNIEITDFRLA
jgi:hypothetical protein